MRQRAVGLLVLSIPIVLHGCRGGTLRDGTPAPSKRARVTPAVRAEAPRPKTQTGAAAKPTKAEEDEPLSTKAAEVRVLVFKSEMEPFATDLTIAQPVVSEENLGEFADAWARLKAGVAQRVTRESLVSISRWGVREMEESTLPAGWIDKIPMYPLRASPDGGRVLFGQDISDGLELPSHSPVVFRRLLVCPVYDKGERAITAVYVTIGGWVEE